MGYMEHGMKRCGQTDTPDLIAINIVAAWCATFKKNLDSITVLVKLSNMTLYRSSHNIVTANVQYFHPGNHTL